MREQVTVDRVRHVDDIGHGLGHVVLCNLEKARNGKVDERTMAERVRETRERRPGADTRWSGTTCGTHVVVPVTWVGGGRTRKTKGRKTGEEGQRKLGFGV